jgi:hypothetical protein
LGFAARERRRMTSNKLFVADMQQQKAAARHVLPAGQRQR